MSKVYMNKMAKALKSNQSLTHNDEQSLKFNLFHCHVNLLQNTKWLRMIEYLTTHISTPNSI